MIMTERKTNILTIYVSDEDRPGSEERLLKLIKAQELDYSFPLSKGGEVQFSFYNDVSERPFAYAIYQDSKLSTYDFNTRKSLSEIGTERKTDLYT